MKNVLGDNLYNYRRKKGLTQFELGERLNVTSQTISNWERGISMPDPESICNICNVLNISSDELLGLKKVNIKSAQEIKREINSTISYEYTATSAKILPYLFLTDLILAMIFTFFKVGILVFVAQVLYLISFCATLVCTCLAKSPRNNKASYPIFCSAVAVRLFLVGVALFEPVFYLIGVLLFSLLKVISSTAILICVGLAFENKEDVDPSASITAYIVLIIMGLVLDLLGFNLYPFFDVTALFVILRIKKDKSYTSSFYYSKDETIFQDHENDEINKKKALEYRVFSKESISEFKKTVRKMCNMNVLVIVLALFMIPIYIFLNANRTASDANVASLVGYVLLPLIIYFYLFFFKKSNFILSCIAFVLMALSLAIFYQFLMAGWYHWQLPDYSAYLPYTVNLLAFCIYVWLYPEQIHLELKYKFLSTLIIFGVSVYGSIQTAVYYGAGVYAYLPQLIIFFFIPTQALVVGAMSFFKAKRKF